MWGEIKSLDDQVYAMVAGGHLQRWEAREMTNLQRKRWMDQMTAEAERQRESVEKARQEAGAKGGGPPAKRGR